MDIESVVNNFCGLVVTKFSEGPLTERTINITVEALNNLIVNYSVLISNFSHEFHEEFIAVMEKYIEIHDESKAIENLMFLNMELLSIFGKKCQIVFLHTLLASIKCLYDSTDISYPKYLEDADQKQVPQELKEKTGKAFLRIFEHFLCRFTYRIDDVYRLIGNMLTVPNQCIHPANVLACLCRSVPQNESQMWMLLSCLCVFVKLNAALFDSRNEVDALCAEAMQKLTNRVSKMVFNNIGKNILPFMSDFSPVAKSAPLFLENYFQIIYKFIQEDFYVALICCSLVLQKFKYFYRIGAYLSICKYLLSTGKTFWNEICSQYGENPEYFIALQKINPEFTPSWQKRDIPPAILLEFLMNKDVVDDSDVSLIFGQLDTILVDESFEFTYNHYYFFQKNQANINMYLQNFNSRLIIKVLTEHPEVATSMFIKRVMDCMMNDPEKKNDIDLCRVIFLNFNKVKDFSSSGVRNVEKMVQNDAISPFDVHTEYPIHKIETFLKLSSNKDDFLWKLQSDAFFDLFRCDNCIKLVHTLLDKNPYKFIVLSSIIEVIAEMDDYSASNAYRALITYPKLKEMWYENRCEVELELTKLYQKNAYRFGPVCFALCGHSDFRRINSLQIAEYISSNDLMKINEHFGYYSKFKLCEEAVNFIKHSLPTIFMYFTITENGNWTRIINNLINMIFDSDLCPGIDMEDKRSLFYSETLPYCCGDLMRMLFSDSINEKTKINIQNNFNVDFCLNYIQNMLDSFRKILQLGYTDLNNEVMNAMSQTILKFKDFDKHYYSYFLVMQLAMESPTLRSKCLELWCTILSKIKASMDIRVDEATNGAIEYIYWPVLLYSLKFYDENPSAADKIMDFFFLNQKLAPMKLLEKFAGIDFNDKIKKFFERKGIKREVQLNETLQALSGEIINSSPVTCRIQLNQILDLLKKNRNESFQVKPFVTKLLKFLKADVPNDCKMLACRCLSQVTTRDNYAMKDVPISDSGNHTKLLEKIVVDILIPLLNDPLPGHYEIVAFSIQNALTANILNDDKKTLALINQFNNALYTCNENRKPNPANEQEVPFFIINSMNDIHKQIYNDDNCLLYKILPACSISYSLCRFVFPYLLNMDIRNEMFKMILSDILTHHLNESSTSAKSFILSCYSSLIDLNINLGKSIELKKIWDTPTINIGVSEEVIVNAAMECRMYALALKHLLFMRNDNSIISKARIIYENLDDQDELDYLKYKAKYTDSDELIILNPEKDIDAKVKALNGMIDHGAFKRALSDASNLKRANIWNQELDVVIAKAALRLQDWETMKVLTKQNPTDSFEKNIARALSFLDQKNTILFNKEIKMLREKLTKDLQEAANRSTEHIFNEVCKFRIVEDIEDASKGKAPSWNDNYFQNLELAEIGTAVNCAIQDIMSPTVQEANQKKVKIWLALGKLCRKNGKIEKAAVFCDYAIKCSLPDDFDCILERSKVLWAKGQKDDALSLLDANPADPIVQSILLFQRAKMTQIMESAPFAKIKAMYEKSIELNEKNGKAHYQLAQFCDDALVDIVNIIPDCMIEEKNTQQTSTFGKKMGDTNIILENFKEWIITALDHYFIAIFIKESIGTDIIPRIFYLFFDIGAKILKEMHDAKEKLKDVYNAFIDGRRLKLSNILMSMFDIVNKHIESVNLFVLANSITFIISRINNCNKELLNTLYIMIERALSRYPDHVLWNLMYLKLISKSKSDAPFWNINDLNIKDKISKFESVTSKLLEFAPLDLNNISKDDPRRIALHKALDNCGIIVPNKNNFGIKSQDLPVIVELDPDIKQCESKQNPKIIKFHSNDGLSTKFLLKKDRDMRKDMRMMEFCNYLNLIFKRDRRTKQRNFNITTYSVICLTEETSLIEWVDNTQTLNNVLEIGNTLDSQYQFITQNSTEHRIKEFYKIQARWKPRTRQWYAMKFSSPSKWFRAQQEYVHSTAAWSIVGYIVGLGDRHLQNILISSETGAVVHVDFDLLFDKAKMQQYPEKVPFRLTQCIVDGLGIGGIHGTYYSSCSLVFDILKAKKKKLLNVLQPFVDDPLVDSDQVNNKGNILREINRRASCISADNASTVTSNAAVQMLVNQATDPSILSTMFYGWRPYI